MQAPFKPGEEKIRPGIYRRFVNTGFSKAAAQNVTLGDKIRVIDGSLVIEKTISPGHTIIVEPEAINDNGNVTLKSGIKARTLAEGNIEIYI